MSSGTQVDMDWAGTDTGQGGAGAPPTSAPNSGAAGAAYLTDEEILGIERGLAVGSAQPLTATCHSGSRLPRRSGGSLFDRSCRRGHDQERFFGQRRPSE